MVLNANTGNGFVYNSSGGVIAKRPANLDYNCYAITIQSDQRTTGTNENFTINCPNPLNDVWAFRVLDVQMPLTYFLWPDGQTFQFTGDVNGNIVVTVPPGSYSASTLASLIDAEFLANGDTVSTIFDVTTLTFYIILTAGVDATIEIDAGDLIATPELSLLGITAVIAPSTTLASNAPFNFNYPTRINICSDALTNGYSLRSDLTTAAMIKSNVIRSIPTWLTTASYNILDKPTWFYTFGNTKRLSKLDLRLEFQDGTLVDLNTYRWSITIEVLANPNA